jgi:hypothetical protein
MKSVIIPVKTGAMGMVAKIGKIGSLATNTFNRFTRTVVIRKVLQSET